MKSSGVIAPYRVPGVYVDVLVVVVVVTDVRVVGVVVKVVVGLAGLRPTRAVITATKTITTNITTKKQQLAKQLLIESLGICRSEDENPIASCVSNFVNPIFSPSFSIL